MSGELKNSYFSFLPNELLIKILVDIDTVDLIHFCEAFDCYYFLKDNKTIETVNVSKRYELIDLRPLSTNMTFEYVTTLNINCLYWIPAYTLREFISKLNNLKTLYAIWTKLGLNLPDTELYNKLKLEKLAVTVRDVDISFEPMPTLKTVYISILKPLKYMPLTKKVEKSWIHVEVFGSFQLASSSISNWNKSKVFCTMNNPCPPLGGGDQGFDFYYTTKRGLQPMTVCGEKFDEKRVPVTLENYHETSPAWVTLKSLLVSYIPWGPRDARNLYLRDDKSSTTYFEELNFYHIAPPCLEKCREAQKTILKSESTSRLKKLCIMTCTLEDNKMDQPAEESNGFKKKRVGVSNSSDSHSIKEIFGNFPNLEELEIFDCKEFCPVSAIQAFPFIANFEKLKSLTLSLPAIVDGSFLTQVLQSCQLLEILRITSLGQPTLNFNLCNALPHAKSLKDFRYENYTVPLDVLLDSLSSIQPQKLERFVLICNSVTRFSEEPLKKFLQASPKLVFLYFLIRGIAHSRLKLAQRTLNEYKKLHPARDFFAKNCEVGDNGFPVPEIHNYEMMKLDSRVAALNPLEEFQTF